MQSLEMDDDWVASLVKHLKRDGRANPDAVQSMLIKCAVQLPAKVPLYSLLIGTLKGEIRLHNCSDYKSLLLLRPISLMAAAVVAAILGWAPHAYPLLPRPSLPSGMLNVEEPGFVEGILRQTSAELQRSLETPATRRTARLLLRFLAALVVPRVVQPAAVLDVLSALVAAAAGMVAAAAPGDDGRTWQPYADELVYMALAALPFGSVELWESAPERVAALVAAAEGYVASRPRDSQPALRPFAAAVREDDPLAE